MAAGPHDPTGVAVEAPQSLVYSVPDGRQRSARLCQYGGTPGPRASIYDSCITHRCDNLPQNFWHPNNGSAVRSAEVVLRRNSKAMPAGLATGVSCTTFGAGTTSPTWWRYSNIYVR